MTSTCYRCHILALEVTGTTCSSPRDLSLSLAILSELLATCEAYAEAKTNGAVVTAPSDFGLYVMFREDRAGPFLCALELCESLREFPLMSVRMVVHVGEVEGSASAKGVSGEAIDEIRQLLQTARPGQVLISEEFAESLEGVEELAERASVADASRKPRRIEPQRLVILAAGDANFPEPSSGQDATPFQVAVQFESALTDDGHAIFLDHGGGKGVDWARSIEAQIRSADTLIFIADGRAAGSELLQYELELAEEERRKRGRPYIVPIWLNAGPPPESPLAALCSHVHHSVWTEGADRDRVVDEVRMILARGQAETEADRLDTTGNAVSGNSEYYIRRAADRDFEDALSDQESILLVKGPRQVGKTTLLGRGIELIDDAGWRCAATDFQMLGARQLESETAFYRVVVTTLSRQLGFDFDYDGEWLANLAPILNMDGFMRDLLRTSDRPLVWFMDEADRLFASPFATDFFGLIRSWHNSRATDPTGPWERLTVVIGYATEAHLFIKDLNKSPFNVGLPIAISMFSLEDTIDLNKRYGHPIVKPEGVRALHALVGGQPFLTRRAFDALSSGTMSIDDLLAKAEADDGPFADHLKRILVSVTRLQTVWEALEQSLSLPDLPDLTESEGFQRLIAANILVRLPTGRFEFPCELYRRYLTRYLNPGGEN